MKYLHYILVLVLLSSFALAAPPFIESTSTNTVGIEIRQPALSVGKFGENIYPHAHIFNASNGLSINTSTTCYLHLYNRTGNHILIQSSSTVEDGFDYGFDIGAGNFSYIGLYSFILQCQNLEGKIGGFVSGGFEITESGMSSNEFGGLYSIAAMIGLGILAFLLLYFTFNLDDVHIILKVLNILFSMIFMFMIPLVLILESKLWINIYKTYIGYFVVFLLYVFYLFFYWVYQKLTATVQETDK